MAAVPQGAFAVRKIREMNEQEFLQMDFHIKNGNEKNYRHGSFKKNLTEGLYYNLILSKYLLK